MSLTSGFILRVSFGPSFAIALRDVAWSELSGFAAGRGGSSEPHRVQAGAG